MIGMCWNPSLSDSVLPPLTQPPPLFPAAGFPLTELFSLFAADSRWAPVTCRLCRRVGAWSSQVVQCITSSHNSGRNISALTVPSTSRANHVVQPLHCPVTSSAQIPLDPPASCWFLFLMLPMSSPCLCSSSQLCSCIPGLNILHQQTGVLCIFLLDSAGRKKIKYL